VTHSLRAVAIGEPYCDSYGESYSYSFGEIKSTNGSNGGMRSSPIKNTRIKTKIGLGLEIKI
jgi:hypothetical protein